jgi:hypothetical protein
MHHHLCTQRLSLRRPWQEIMMLYLIHLGHPQVEVFLEGQLHQMKLHWPVQ